MTESEAKTDPRHRPTYPHVESLERVAEDFLDVTNVTITEKLHGSNARFGVDELGVSWVGTRNLDYDLDTAPPLQGLTAFARAALERWRGERLLAGDPLNGVTFYGEWAGKGIQKGIDYGKPDFYLFAFRWDDDPLQSELHLVRAMSDVINVQTVPFLHQGPLPTVDELDQLRDGTSLIAVESIREGIVIAPVRPVLNKYGGQVIAKHKSVQFKETANAAKAPRVPVDTARADDFAETWVTEHRLEHVLAQVTEGKEDCDGLAMELTGDVLRAMYADVVREGSHEFDALDPADQRLVGKAVNRVTLALLKEQREAAFQQIMSAKEAG